MNQDNQPAELALRFVMLGTTLIFTILVLYISRFGFEFTDESLYLNWLSDPFANHPSASQFGFVYHPLYMLAEGNIVRLRQFNVIITLALSVWFVKAFLDTYAIEVADKAQIWSLSFGLGSAGFLLFTKLSITPHYNSLCLQGLLLAGTGLMILQNHTASKRLLGLSLLSLGGSLAFLAKPPSALLLAIISVVYLALSRKLSLFILSAAAFFAFIIICTSAWLIDGSLAGFIDRYLTSMKMASAMDAGYGLNEIVRMYGWDLRARGRILFYVLSLLSTVTLCLIGSNKPLASRFGYLLIGIMVLISCLAVLGLDALAEVIRKVQGPEVLYAPLAAALYLVFSEKASSFISLDRHHWLGLMLCAALPYAFSLGTNNSYLRWSSFAGIFWCAGGLLLLLSQRNKQQMPRVLVTYVILAQAGIAILLLNSFEFPYRQAQALNLNDTRVEIGQERSELLMPANVAGFINEIRASARAAGFTDKTELLDLTGQSPGILIVLGADRMGEAWTIGGYAGSAELATMNWGKIPCSKLANAWLLHNPDGPRSLPDTSIKSFGADLEDYEIAATWKIGEGVGTSWESDPAVPRIQYLLKPLREEIISVRSCEAMRAQSMLTSPAN